MTDQPADKKYYTTTDKSNGVDYTCTVKYYIDKGVIHIVDTHIEPPKKSKENK